MKKVVVLLLGCMLPATPFAGPSTQVVADHLEIPWALAFAPDSRTFVTERTGRLRVINADGTL